MPQSKARIRVTLLSGEIQPPSRLTEIFRDADPPRKTVSETTLAKRVSLLSRLLKPGHRFGRLSRASFSCKDAPAIVRLPVSVPSFCSSPQPTFTEGQITSNTATLQVFYTEL